MVQPQHLPYPEPFLELLVHGPGLDPATSGLCAGYEDGEWRVAQLCKHLEEWLPEFALTLSEYTSTALPMMVRQVRKAAQLVYATDKYQKRGEFGELLLHVALRQVFNSWPAVCKLYYKDAPNDTVKGFDSAHVVDGDDGLELWLGEAKLYDDPTAAVKAAAADLVAHAQTDYLRREFLMLTNKLDRALPHYDELKQLLDPNTTLDKVFKAVVVPVLIAYNSQTVRAHTASTAEYKAAFQDEVGTLAKTFRDQGLPDKLRIHLIFVPLKDKAAFVSHMHDRLAQWRE